MKKSQKPINKVRSFKMGKKAVVRAKAITRNNRKKWTATDGRKLTRMYGSGRLTVRQIAKRLGRSYFATTKQASRLFLTYGKKSLKNWSV